MSTEGMSREGMSWEGLKGFLRDGALALAIAFVAWFLWVQLFAPRPVTSGPAPDFALQDLAGTVVELPDEGPVILNFWFTTCPPCRREIPELARFHEAHPEIPFYGVSIDRMGARRLAVTAEKLGITYPVLQDPDSAVAARYGVTLFPTTVVIDDGAIHAVRMGEVDQQVLEQLVAGL